MRGARFDLGVLNLVLERRLRIVIGLGALEILLLDDAVPLFETLIFQRF